MKKQDGMSQICSRTQPLEEKSKKISKGIVQQI